MGSSKAKYMGFKEIAAYSLGLFGFQAIVGLLNSYQAEFDASILGADIAVVGILVLVAKILSAVFDPFVGNMIDRSKSKKGKFKSMIAKSILPLLVMTSAVFIDVPFKTNKVAVYIWIFVTYLLWSFAMTLGDVPSQGIASVLTPDPTERTNVVSISNTFKQIGFSACVVIVPIACLIIPGGSKVLVKSGETDLPMIANEYQAANILLGSQNLVAVLGISTAIGTMISMAACPFLIKKLDEKKVFIGLSVYGFIASVFSFVIAHFWFINPGNTVLTVLFYFSLFLLGLQFASVNLMPMIMTADCVDYYEYETGKRMEGTAYSVLTLTIKICLALGMALGLVFVQVSGYSDTVREIAAGTAAGFTTKTKDTVFFAYSVVPGILSLLSAFPIFKYDIVGKKKQEISDALQARRAAAEK